MAVYESMKDSKVTWLGLIPEVWELTTISALYDLRNEKVSDRDYPPLSVTMKGIVPQLESAAKTDNGDNRKLVKKGDFVINSRSDRRGACGISNYDGSVSLINTVLTPKGKIHPGYYNWLFHTVTFADEFYKWGHGIVDDLWTTRWQEMKRITIPVPTFETQLAIAAYLDDQCTKIDALISEAKTSIEEYKQWKASIITETVTKGLKPHGSLRESRLAWVKIIPANWQTKKIKFLQNEEENAFSDGDWIETPYITDSGIRYLTTGNIGDGKFKRQGNGFISSETFQKLNCKYAYPGDLVFSRLNAPYGRSCILPDDYEKYVLAVDNVILRTNENKRYLCYVTQCSNYQEAVLDKSAGTTMKRISRTNLGNIEIPLPPIDEQNLIADFLDNQCGIIDNIIEKKESIISELEQYKCSLIYETVTGKRKVV